MKKIGSPTEFQENVVHIKTKARATNVLGILVCTKLISAIEKVYAVSYFYYLSLQLYSIGCD